MLRCSEGLCKNRFRISSLAGRLPPSASLAPLFVFEQRGEKLPDNYLDSRRISSGCSTTTRNPSRENRGTPSGSDRIRGPSKRVLRQRTTPEGSRENSSSHANASWRRRIPAATNIIAAIRFPVHNWIQRPNCRLEGNKSLCWRPSLHSNTKWRTPAGFHLGHYERPPQ
jgi:hypothetical protein